MRRSLGAIRIEQVFNVMVLPLVITVRVRAFFDNLTDGTGKSEVLCRRSVIASHKALMHDVRKLEELFGLKVRAGHQSIAKVSQGKLPRSRASDVEPVMVFPVELADKAREIFAVLVEDRELLRDDQVALRVILANCGSDTRERGVEVELSVS